MKFSRGWWAVFLVLAVVFAKAYSVQAWDCGDYNFRVTSSGSVQVENESDSDEPSQEADVFVNGDKIINDADVPAMKAGTDWTEFEEINPPPGSWSWRVKGESDCADSGEHEVEPTRTPQPSKTPTRVPPTDTPKPSATFTPKSSDTQEPTVTPVPSGTPEPPATNTPVPPSDTPEPTPVPTNTPKPSDTPKPDPTVTPKPTNTPKPNPTDTPKPNPTKPAPTSTQKPSATLPPVTSTAQLATPPTEIPPTETASATPYVCVVCCICGTQTPIVVEVNVEAPDFSPVAEELKPIFYVLVGIFAMLGGSLILGVYNSIKK